MNFGIVHEGREFADVAMLDEVALDREMREAIEVARGEAGTNDEVAPWKWLAILALECARRTEAEETGA